MMMMDGCDVMAMWVRDGGDVYFAGKL